MLQNLLGELLYHIKSPSRHRRSKSVGRSLLELETQQNEQRFSMVNTKHQMRVK